MNPPPRRPDDGTPPPLPPEGAAPPPARDPLLDDPLFAELVAPRPGPDLPLADPVLTPAEAALPFADPLPPADDEPALAEVVADAPPDLPVARPVDPAPLPRAQPVRAEPAPRAAPWPPPPRPARGPRPADAPAERPRPRVYAACGVIGCLSVGVVAAVGFLAYAAVVILGHFGNQIADGDRPPAPTARPGPVAPTTLPANRTVALDGLCDAVGRGAGGRYLLLRVPSRRQVAVFDPNVGDVVHTVTLAEPNALFAASASKLFVYNPEARTIDRWNLVTWEKEHTAPRPDDLRDVDAVAVGAGADGPVFLMNTAAARPADVRALDPDELKQTGAYTVRDWQAGAWPHVRASDDGTVFGVAGDAGALALRFNPGSGFEAAKLLTKGERPKYATPAPDGKYLYTARGVFRPDGVRVVPRSGDEFFFTFPTAHASDLFLHVGVSPPRDRFEGPLEVYRVGANQPLTTVAGVPVPHESVDEMQTLPADQRVHVWPGAGVVAVLPKLPGSLLQVYRVTLPK
jgi:hypothetical protein